MNKIFLILFILIVSVLIGTQMTKDPGYLLIIYGDTSIETNLWVALIVAIIAFVLIQMIFKLLALIIMSPKKIHMLGNKHKAKRSIYYTSKSLNEILEKRWHSAEKNAIKAIPGSNISAFNYIVAAKAAQQQKALNRRDSYLRQAKQFAPKKQITVELAQIYLQIDAKQWQQALANLQNLYHQNLARKHPIIIELLYRVLTQLENWEQLYKIYPEIHRNHILTKQPLSLLETSIFQGMLKMASNDIDRQKIKDIWKNMPRRLHKSPQLAAIYVEKLMNSDENQEAEHILTACLKSQIDDQLIVLYGKLEPQNPSKHLQLAEKWLKACPDHPGLLLTLGHICIQQQLWGKARRYLEQAQAINKSPQAYALLAKLCEQVGEADQALAYYREGLLMRQ